MLCTEVPSSFFSPCVCLSVVPSYLPSNLSCKHTSASSKCEHTGFLPTSSVWLGKLPHFLRWESTERHPLYPTSCAYIVLSCLLSLYQCVGHLCSDLSVWGDGVLQPCPFPWCVVVCFNGDFSLCSFLRVCAFLLLLIPASGEHYWQGGPCWHTNVWIVSVLFFSSPLFPSLSLSQWCVQKRKSSSSVHLMVSTSRKLPAIRASAIFHAMHARLVLITLHSMSVQGGGRGDQCALKGPCPH